MERVAQFYALAHHVSLLLRLPVPRCYLGTSHQHLSLSSCRSALNAQPSTLSPLVRAVRSSLLAPRFNRFDLTLLFLLALSV